MSSEWPYASAFTMASNSAWPGAMLCEESIVVFKRAGRDFDPAGAGWHRAVQAPVYRAATGDPGRSAKATMVSPGWPTSSSSSASRSWGTGISHAAISFFARAHEAQLAAAQRIALAHADRRPEHAAGHRPPRVHIAASGGGIERRAGGIVGKFLEPFLIFNRGAQNAGFHVARKVGPVLVEPCLRPALHLSCERRIAGPKRIHADAKPLGIQRVDCKSPMAALRAADPAGEPGAQPGVQRRPGPRP